METIDNPLEIEPVHLNGAAMVMTKEQYGISLLQVKKWKKLKTVKVKLVN
ncbi:hypothetical protein H9659_14980 [Sporosarcina sp. Sa3CUA8]|uniref:Uncharacterized protein n=1 Tax=Sporosarcina gallistercoris TaxID=2762245 RepID=A0ABR8PNF0_9BACL|nr:hypothetical protein [Sporosarcina gallistercoris]